MSTNPTNGPFDDDWEILFNDFLTDLENSLANSAKKPAGRNTPAGSSSSKPHEKSKNLSHRQKVEIKNWRKGLGQKWPHLTKEEINAANPDTTYRSAEAVKVKASGRVPKNVEISRNTPKSKPISNIGQSSHFFGPHEAPNPVVADTVKFTKIDKPGFFGLPYRHSPKKLPEQYDRYHPKSTFTPSNVDLNSRRQLDTDGFHLSKEQIDADVAKQTEDFTNNRRKNMPFIKSLFAKKYDSKADGLTAAYSGFKTNLFDKPDGTPITETAGVQEDVLKSELPEQLRGVSNLQNEKDLFKFRAAYDQDLINDRLGKKANYVDLTDDDIFQSSVRSTDLNEGDLFSSKGAAGGYGWAEHRMYSGTLTNLNPRSLKYGYGMGWGNAWRASSKDHLKRGVAVVSPLSRGNLSAMGEMLGRATTRDLLNFKANPTIMNRLTTVLPSGGVAGLLGYGMMEMQDPSELMTNWLAPAAAIYGGRVGVALGGALTPAKTAANWGLLRGAGLAIGSTLGFVTGLTAASLVGMGISSAMTNDSSVRKFANSLNKIEIYSPQIDNRQTLTARQQALNKLSKSGLNDRALLLGNEAAALRGLI